MVAKRTAKKKPTGKKTAAASSRKVTKKKTAAAATKKSASKAKKSTAKKATKKVAAKKKPVAKKVTKKAAVKKKPTRTKAATKKKKRVARRPPLDLRAFRKQLRQKQAELLQVYNSAKGDSRSRQTDGTEDYIDYAVSSYDREFLLSLTELEQKQLMLVEEALERLEKGKFGDCCQCGKIIPSKRLEAQPWARYCLSCQELADQGISQGDFDADLDDDGLDDDSDLDDELETEDEVESAPA